MKPSGIRIAAGPSLRVTRSTLEEDAIWDAVQTAQLFDMTVDEFRRECAEAWAQGLRDKAKEDAEAWRK